MEDLIKALQILVQYGNPYAPTHCEHDLLTICIDPFLVTSEDIATLDKLGVISDGNGGFKSYRFGSA